MLGNANGIDLNNFPLHDLDRVGGVARVLAQRIIEHRPFRRRSDLLAIKSVDKDFVNDLRGSGAILGRPNPSSATTKAMRPRTTRPKKSTAPSAPKGPTRLPRNIFTGRGQVPE